MSEDVEKFANSQTPVAIRELVQNIQFPMIKDEKKKKNGSLTCQLFEFLHKKSLK